MSDSGETVTSLLSLYEECKKKGEDVSLTMETRNGHQVVTFHVPGGGGVLEQQSSEKKAKKPNDNKGTCGARGAEIMKEPRKKRLTGRNILSRFPTDTKDVKFN